MGQCIGRFIEKPMINYFSIGEESRLGYAFDKKRTRSQTCNLLVYFMEGCSHSAQCLAADGISEVVAGMYHGTGPDDCRIFDTDESENSQGPRLKTNPQVLLVLNINSFGGGLSHFWPNSRRLAVDRPLHPELLSQT